MVHLQNNNPNLLNAIGVSGVSTNPGLNAIGNMQPMQAQKYLNQGAHNASGTGECQLSNIPILRFKKNGFRLIVRSKLLLYVYRKWI